MTKKTFLFIEDDEGIRLAVAYLIRTEFPQVNTLLASNGREGLAILMSKQVDFFISDMRMPIMNGQDLLRVTAGDSRMKMIPYYICSALTKSELAEIQKIAPGTRCLKKPFQFEELYSVIRTEMNL